MRYTKAHRFLDLEEIRRLGEVKDSQAPPSADAFKAEEPFTVDESLFYESANNSGGTMDYTKVENSSNVEEIAYDEPNKICYVRFKGFEGALYRYFDVPEQDGRMLVATAGLEQISTGHWVNRLLKQTNLKYEKLTGRGAVK